MSTTKPIQLRFVFQDYEEDWKGIPGFPGYEVSNKGRVRSFWGKGAKAAVHSKAPIILKQKLDRSTGRFNVILRSAGGARTTEKVHRLVLFAFVGSPGLGLESRHGPNGRLDNSLGNLSWGTRQDNMKDRVRDGTQQRGERHGQAKLTDEKVRAIKKMLRSKTQATLASEFGVDPSIISNINTGRLWSHVTGR